MARMRCTSCGVSLNPETMECSACDRKTDNYGRDFVHSSTDNHATTVVFVVIVAIIGALIYGAIFGMIYAVIGAAVGAAIVTLSLWSPR